MQYLKPKNNHLNFTKYKIGWIGGIILLYISSLNFLTGMAWVLTFTGPNNELYRQLLVLAIFGFDNYWYQKPIIHTFLTVVVLVSTCFSTGTRKISPVGFSFILYQGYFPVSSCQYKADEQPWWHIGGSTFWQVYQLYSQTTCTVDPHSTFGDIQTRSNLGVSNYILGVLHKQGFQ